ncbi:MAG: DNA mismatch repair endonuclease MutL [Deltaproteobacteria bacterium]|jgi:DNA mismatch repair protein MutL|nr:DNA mismatch repair endonuclease MutL [Deltaproteobacteria bacterium]
MASRIKLLPDNLINQIAAGEVIERPASILKELLDNSLDAGATRLEVEAVDGGKKLLRVTDNGCGLNKEELYLCLERHATSKIGPDSDLMNIQTLGFRGEALPSIGSVARLAITSSPSSDGPGHKIRLEGGRLMGLDPVPANQGTMVEVKDLFFNVPARRKFLKTDNTEKAHLLDVAQRYALSRPDIRLVFKDQDRVVFQVDSQQDLKARVAGIMGPDIARSLRTLSYSQDDLKITGYLGGPEWAGKSGAQLFLYVLGRPVRDRLLTKAVTQGYGRTLPTGRWPAGLIFLDLDPRRVDVNVHPAKTEVRFREAGEIFNVLTELAARVIQAPPSLEPESFKINSPETDPKNPDQQDLSPPKPPSSPADSSGHHYRVKTDYETSFGPKARTYPNFQKIKIRPPSPETLNQKALPPPPWVDGPEEPAEEAESYEPGSNPPKEAGNAISLKPESKSEGELAVLGQLNRSYILAQGPEGLHIIDQHAAHERLVFNQLKENLALNGLPSQRALFPDTIELSPHQTLALDILGPGLSHLGFELEPFGGATYVIKGFPECIEPDMAKEAITEILDKAQHLLKTLEGAGLKEIITQMADTWLDSLACRAAVKAGQKLTEPEMENLLFELQKAKDGGYCPHGRPSSLVFTYRELEIKFGRK